MERTRFSESWRSRTVFLPSGWLGGMSGSILIRPVVGFKALCFDGVGDYRQLAVAFKLNPFSSEIGSFGKNGPFSPLGLKCINYVYTIYIQFKKERY